MKLSEICLIVDKPYYNTLQVYGHSEDASDGWGERRGHIHIKITEVSKIFEGKGNL